MTRWTRKLGRRQVVGLSIIVLGFAVWFGATPAETPATLEVKRTLARQAARVESLDVSYRLVTTTELAPAQLRSLSNFRNQLFLPDEDWHEAYKGIKRFKHQVQPEAVTYLAEVDPYGLVPPSPPRPDDTPTIRDHQLRLKSEYDKAIALLKAQEAARGGKRVREASKLRDPSEREVTRATNGRSLWLKRPITPRVAEFQTWPVGSSAHWFGLSAYASAVGLQPTDPTSKATEAGLSAFRFAELAKDRSYALEDATEVVDGATCLILKGTWNSVLHPAIVVGSITDRIWLDRDHGLAIRRREVRHRGRLAERWENADLREVAPGLWLPAKVRHDRFADDAPAGWGGKPALTETIVASKVEVNRVADGLFDMPVPNAGDLVEDLRGRF